MYFGVMLWLPWDFVQIYRQQDNHDCVAQSPRWGSVVDMLTAKACIVDLADRIAVCIGGVGGR